LPTSPLVDRPNIDALTSLRFFAALYVLFLHSGSHYVTRRLGLEGGWIDNFLANGYLGVSFFFVLSGFILIHVYSRPLVAGDKIFSYALARFARVYPVYLLSLILILPITKDVQLVSAWPQFFLLQSWPLQHLGVSPANWNGPAWTLSVELLFYLMFPILAKTWLKLELPALFTVGAICALLMIGFWSPSIGTGREIAYPALDWLPVPVARLPEFVFGMTLGRIFHRVRNRFDGKWLFRLSLLGAIIALSASPAASISGFAAFFFGLIILAIACSKDGLAIRFLSLRPLVFLGGASYALYILQTPVRLLLGAAFTGNLDMIGRVSYYPTLFVLSSLIFLYFEEPARKFIRGKFR